MTSEQPKREEEEEEDRNAVDAPRLRPSSQQKAKLSEPTLLQVPHKKGSRRRSAQSIGSAVVASHTAEIVGKDGAYSWEAMWSSSEEGEEEDDDVADGDDDSSRPSRANRNPRSRQKGQHAYVQNEAPPKAPTEEEASNLHTEIKTHSTPPPVPPKHIPKTEEKQRRSDELQLAPEGLKNRMQSGRVSSKGNSSATSATSLGENDPNPALVLEDSDVGLEESENSDIAEGFWHEDLAFENLSQYELRAKIADLLQQAPEAYLDKKAISILPERRLMEKKGWVMKTTANSWTAWAWRWLVLKDKQLRWYEDEEETACCGCIDFELIDVEADRLWEIPFRKQPAHKARTAGCCGRASIGEMLLGETKRAKFLVHSKPTIGGQPRGRAFEFGLESQTDADAWVTAIDAHIDAAWRTVKSLEDGPDAGKVDDGGTSEARSASTAKTEQLVLDDLDSGQKWWKVVRITPAKFESIAQTGDLLLFRSEGVYPKLLRTQTGGRFDHVALMVRLDGNKLALVEACGSDNVCLCTWKDFVDFRWFALYRQICLRRVHCNRSEARLSKLQEWLQGIMGKPFNPKAKPGQGMGMGTSTAPLARGQNMGPDDHHMCALFVAEALKVLGVLPQKKSSCQLHAGSFSAKKASMECNQGCRLDGEDLTIDFSFTPGTIRNLGVGGKRWSMAFDANSKSSAPSSSATTPRRE